MSRLDGNAAAGALSEVFAVEVTSAIATCASCGATGPVGTVHCYEGPGAVLRCPECDAVLLRIVRGPGETRLDMRGVASIRWRTTG